MNEINISFQSKDGLKIFARKWLPKEKPRAILQIAHGMVEHSGRYADFAEFMSKNGFAVYANDHRGHGKTTKANEPVYFADENGWEKVVGDMHQLTEIAKNEFPNLPFFLLGHSMGSFLARHYIQLFGSELNGIILSGAGGSPNILGKIIGNLLSLSIAFLGRKALAKRIQILSNAHFNRRFKPKRTPFDWLSRDTEVVDKYLADPRCGMIASFGFHKDVLDGVFFVNKIENVKKTPKKLPIYIFSGNNDPVGEYGSGIQSVYKLFKDAGILDIQMVLYEGGRHEMLNEINHKEVRADLLAWLTEKMKHTVSKTFSNKSKLQVPD